MIAPHRPPSGARPSLDDLERRLVRDAPGARAEPPLDLRPRILARLRDARPRSGRLAVPTTRLPMVAAAALLLATAGAAALLAPPGPPSPVPSASTRAALDLRAADAAIQSTLDRMEHGLEGALAGEARRLVEDARAMASSLLSRMPSPAVRLALPSPSGLDREAPAPTMME